MKTKLPTREQIQALTDIDSLYALKDEIDRASRKIETDLEFIVDDPEWASRARGALSIHRFTSGLISHRLKILKPRAPGTVQTRAEYEIHPLTLEVLDKPIEIDIAAIQTQTEIDEKLLWLAERIDIVNADREEENLLPGDERDLDFIVVVNSALRTMRGLRQSLQSRRGEISRAQKVEQQKAMDTVRERLFIDAARDLLDRETYLRLWDRVSLLEKMGAE